MSDLELKLRLYPDPVLFKRAEDLPVVDETTRERARQMFDIMYEAGGIGLAGPQVGWSGRIFVINLTAEPDHPEEELVFINPQVRSPEGRDTMEEGCLSIPDVRADVSRPERIEVEALSLDGEPFSLTAYGLLARCIQHEFDHLDGILFVTRLSLGDKLRVKRPLKELERKFKEAKAAG